MTSITQAPGRSARQAAGTLPASRIIPVLRLHLTNKWTTLGTPLLILLGIFLVNYIIWQLVYNAAAPGTRADSMDGTQYTGAIYYVFVYMLIVGVQCILRTFPFALGFSVTRRDFYLGTALLFVTLSAIYTIVLTIMSYLEEATGGWGLGGHMFSTVWFGTGSLGQRLAVAFCAFVFVFFVGAAVSTVYLRWRSTGQIVLWAGVSVIGLALAALITFTNNWPAVGDWFVDSGTFGVTLWSLVITVLAALFGYRILRRATPVN